MASTDNDERVAAASEALGSYAAAKGAEDEPWKDVVTDLLGDLMHLIAAEPEAFKGKTDTRDPEEWLADRLQMAGLHYGTEQED